MKNIPIESFFLALSVTKLFPLARFIQPGSIGKVYYADFDIPFSVNDEILSQIQELMKGKIKENQECKVLDMLPKIARDYLHHHAKKDLACQVDLDLPMISIVQIGDFYALSSEEVENHPATAQVKVFSFSIYLDAEEKKITRIYGLAAKDSKELKETYKEVSPFFKREVLNAFQTEKIADLKGNQLFLLHRGRAFKNEITSLMEEVLNPFGIQVAESIESQTACEYGIISPLSYQKLIEAPPWESLLFGFLEPFFTLNCEIQGDLELKVYSFTKRLLDWLNHYNLKLQKEIESGEEYGKISTRLSELTYFHVKQLKNKKKFNLKIDLVHPLGQKVRLLKIQIEEKELKNFLKIEAFFHPASLLAWLEDGKMAIKN